MRDTDLTVKNLKVGTRVFFGRCKNIFNGNIQEISWLKADTGSTFISEFIPQMYGNVRYRCVGSVLNSLDEFVDAGCYAVPGFLSCFREDERNLIESLGIPSLSSLKGSYAYPLFKRKGVRAKCGGSPADYWVSGALDTDTVGTYIAGNGMARRAIYAGCGLRPVCVLSQNAKVALNDDGNLAVVPYEWSREPVGLLSETDLFDFLGLR